jgi:hypothetical protein
MRFFSVVVCSVLFIGCGKNSADEFEKLANRACECAAEDAACGSKVLSDVAKFTESHKMSDGDIHRINEAGKRVYDCLSQTGVKPTDVTATLEKMVD